ncbi:MAG TPA: UDP-N-acetylmuramate dehydrogenase [Acidimicrobiia bacterium]|nr:UDP-N-acetylmuramate dehydrogenase [Acidimicrobiia bacterium]
MSALAALVASGAVSEHVPLGPYTTYKAGGPARFMTEVQDVAALMGLVEAGVATDLPILVLGRGSNLVVADAGFRGLVIRLGSEFARVEVEGTRVRAGGAAPLAHVARSSVDGGLAGLEFFVGVPGSVGGAVRQNAGCFGTETRDRLITASIIDLTDGLSREAGPDDLDMSYRHSNVGSTQIVVDALFQATPGDGHSGRAELRRITRWRRDNQPGGTFNAGSVFKNPPGATAGEIIDSLGLKGLAVGDVSVSPKHANFFVAGPGATSDDIRRLVHEVKDRVLEKTGTMLEPEIQFVGFENDH